MLYLFCWIIFAGLVIACGCFYCALQDAVNQLNIELNYGRDLRNVIHQLREDNSCLEVEAEQRKETIRLTTIAMLERSKEVQRLNAKLSAITATINSDEVNK